MCFVAKLTTIPVPRVYCAFRHRNRTYIVMERIHGDPLWKNWYSRPEGEKKEIWGQLKEMLAEMRSMTPPEGVGVANACGGTLYDPRIGSTSSRFGPFHTLQEFHKFLRGGLEDDPQHYPEIRELISQHNDYWPAPVFTHGDLSSSNILVSGNKVVGIIDWETAGWYPFYWEYTTACLSNTRGEVDNFLQPLPKELEMELKRNKYFGDV